MRFRFARLTLLFLLAGCGPAPTPPREVRVAAAADLKFAFDDIKKTFAEREPGVTVTATYGSSGTLHSQIANDAPFDVFLSADVDYAKKLIELGKADEPVFQYAVGHLVVWVPNESELDLPTLGVRVVAESRVKKAALANPKTAPYGRAAEAALRHLGLYDGVQPKLVFAENVAQAAQFAESGAADVGLIAKSLALSPPLKNRGRFVAVPADAYPKLEQAGVILKTAKDPAAAKLLQAFLTGDAGKTILARYGFTPPEG